MGARCADPEASLIRALFSRPGSQNEVTAAAASRNAAATQAAPSIPLGELLCEQLRVCPDWPHHRGRFRRAAGRGHRHRLRQYAGKARAIADVQANAVATDLAEITTALSCQIAGPGVIRGWVAGPRHPPTV
jgi:hypothetical protein